MRGQIDCLAIAIIMVKSQANEVVLDGQNKTYCQQVISVNKFLRRNILKSRVVQNFLVLEMHLTNPQKDTATFLEVKSAG